MNDRNQLIKYWLKSAESDLAVAEHLFEKKDYHYCLYLAHLVLEKTFKAIFVQNIGPTPPYKHALPLLAEKAGIELSDSQETFLEEVTDFNIYGC